MSKEVDKELQKIKKEIPWIEIDANFPQCPHCGRLCEDVYEHLNEHPNCEIFDVTEMYDSYYGVHYHDWRTVITCPDCSGKFQFNDGSA